MKQPLPKESRPPKILLLGSQMAVAGAQRVLLSQADWLTEHGYSVVAAFLYDRDGLQDRWQAEHSSYPIINLQAYRPGSGAIINSLLFVRGVARLLRLMLGEKFTAVETFTHHSNLIGCPVAWLAGIPMRIASHHGRIAGMPMFLERLHAWMVNLGIANYLVAVSQDVMDQSVDEGVSLRRLVLIPNGILPLNGNSEEVEKLRRESLLEGKEKLLLAVGRLTYQKGHEILLEALPAVLEQFPHTQLFILGDGPLREDLQRQADRLGISDHVHLAGVRLDVATWMSAADLFILPSRWEGLPLVLLEAMSVGLPIVATDVQGAAEALQNGSCGLIVPVENPAALGSAILRLLADCDYRRQLGQTAQKRFLQEYTLEKMMVRYEYLLVPESRKVGQDAIDKR